jgi:hypothetical protein
MPRGEPSCAREVHSKVHSSDRWGESRSRPHLPPTERAARCLANSQSLAKWRRHRGNQGISPVLSQRVHTAGSEDRGQFHPGEERRTVDRCPCSGSTGTASGWRLSSPHRALCHLHLARRPSRASRTPGCGLAVITWAEPDRHSHPAPACAGARAAAWA